MNNYSNWDEYTGTVEGSGRSQKFWLQNPDTGQIALFKVKKDRNTTDHISERIAYQLAEKAGIECAYYAVGMYHGQEGSLSYNILQSEEETLKEGIYYIGKKYPSYDADNMYDTKTQAVYSFEMIEESLQEYGFMNDFLKIPVFDFFIGNTDRHQNNWAVLERAGREQISPLYDNSSSLCAYEKEPEVYLGKDAARFDALVDTKSRSAIRLKKTDLKKPTHKQVLWYLNRRYPQAVEWEQRLLDYLTQPVINDILNDYDSALLSDNKKELIARFLKAKRYILQQILMGKE